MFNFAALLSSSSSLFTENMHNALGVLTDMAIVIIEFLGLLVIVVTGIKAFLEWIRKDERTRLHLSEGLSTALSFLLCGEILRTILFHDLSEVLLIGSIVILRVALTLLIHWEAGKEKEELEGLHKTHEHHSEHDHHTEHEK